MKKKQLLILPLLALVFLETGCTSYSFRGAHATPAPTNPVSLDKKYKLTSYNNSFKASATPWSITGYGAIKLSKRDIERQLVDQYPNYFTRDEQGIPIKVSVDLENTKRHMWGLVPYLATLGIYPARIINFEDDCAVTVSVLNAKKTGNVRFRSNSWLSVWTPFGLTRKDKPDNFTGEHRHGSGVMIAPHLSSKCATDQKETYLVEVCDEVAAIIMSWPN